MATTGGTCSATHLPDDTYFLSTNLRFIFLRRPHKEETPAADEATKLRSMLYMSTSRDIKAK